MNPKWDKHTENHSWTQHNQTRGSQRLGEKLESRQEKKKVTFYTGNHHPNDG